MRLLLSLGIVFLLVIACGETQQTNQSSPEAAAKGLFTALKLGDFETAKLYGTQSTKESIQDFATNLKMSSPEDQKELLAPFEMEISKVTCAETNGITKCKVCCSPAGDIEIPMVEQDGKWFAQMEFAF